MDQYWGGGIPAPSLDQNLLNLKCPSSQETKKKKSLGWLKEISHISDKRLGHGGGLRGSTMGGKDTVSQMSARSGGSGLG